MVLEALAALSLAASVVQFIDFSGKLISKGNEFHKSGKLVEHTELVAVAGNLEKLSEALGDSLKAFRPESGLSSEEQALAAVAQQCQTIASEFNTTIQVLTNVEGTNKTWKSFRQAFKTVWNKDKIQEMKDKLNLAREQLVIHLLVVMR
jgi:hypothetical protein